MYELPNVPMDSELVSTMFELERLRGNLGSGDASPRAAAEMHALFQLLTSIVSARIEGNRTTVADALEANDGNAPADDRFLEFMRLDEAAAEIDQADPEQPLTQLAIRNLHRQVTEGLQREGDSTPGVYRSVDVGILRSAHAPPPEFDVKPLMGDLVDAANRLGPHHARLLTVAIVHHRFLWIHPFRNGNGRVSRLLSYAMLRRAGFVSPLGFRTVNPTAIFGSDREGYYEALAAADDLSNEGTVRWCQFFMAGLRTDLERLTALESQAFLREKVVGPAIVALREQGAASERESKALQIAFDKDTVRASDLLDALPGQPSARSNAIRGMVDRGLLAPLTEGGRIYRLPLATGPLAQRVVQQLDRIGYLPSILRD